MKCLKVQCFLLFERWNFFAYFFYILSKRLQFFPTVFNMLQLFVNFHWKEGLFLQISYYHFIIMVNPFDRMKLREMRPMRYQLYTCRTCWVLYPLCGSGYLNSWIRSRTRIRNNWREIYQGSTCNVLHGKVTVNIDISKKESTCLAGV